MLRSHNNSHTAVLPMLTDKVKVLLGLVLATIAFAAMTGTSHAASLSTSRAFDNAEVAAEQEAIDLADFMIRNTGAYWYVLDFDVTDCEKTAKRSATCDITLAVASDTLGDVVTCDEEIKIKQAKYGYSWTYRTLDAAC